MVLAKIRRPFSLTLSGHHCMLIYRFYTFLTKPLLWIILHSKIWINYDSAIYECSWERWKVDVEDPGRSILTAPPQCPSQPLHSENHEKVCWLLVTVPMRTQTTLIMEIVSNSYLEGGRVKHREKVRRHRLQKPMTMGSQWRQVGMSRERRPPFIFQVCDLSSVAIAGCLEPRHCTVSTPEQKGELVEPFS